MDIFDLIQQGKVKRYFSARNKVSFPGAICHVTQRAPGRELLFVEDSDYLHALHLIKNVSKEFNIKILSFALMPNHIHLLLQLVKENLPAAMQSLFWEYARYFNAKYERKGHTFCGRYRQALCFDESYLLAASVYIHINPVVAGLTDDVLKYRWSSVIPFLQEQKKETFIDYRFILDIIDDNIMAARKNYEELVSQALKIKIADSGNTPSALHTFREALEPFFGTLPLNKRIFAANSSIDSLLENFMVNKYGRDPNTMKGKRYLIEQMKARGYKISEIAQKLNLARQTVHRILSR